MGVLRVILAGFVVLAHITRLPWLRVMSGAHAVQCFYIISGFYMALVLSRKYQGEGARKGFWLSRFFRLWPGYAVVLVLTLAIALLLPVATGRHSGLSQGWERYMDTLNGGWLAILAALNGTLWLQDIAHFIAIDPATQGLHLVNSAAPGAVEGRELMLVPQAWTLGVELWFYLLAPFLVRRPLWLLSSLAGASLAARGWAFSLGFNRPPWDYRFFPFELSLFLLGVIAYRIYERHEPSLENAGRRMAVAAGLLLILTVGFSLVSWPTWLGLSAFYLVFAALLPALFHVTKNNSWDRWFGEFSYLIYIVHLVLLNTVALLIVSPPIRLFIFGLSLALTCWVLRKWVEDPVSKWRGRRFGA